MGLFQRKRRKTIAELEEESERLTIETEVATKEAELAERQAIIAELKRKYGRNWTRTLGIKGTFDTATLRSFLVSAKKGLEKAGTSGDSTPLGRKINPSNFRGVPKA